MNPYRKKSANVVRRPDSIYDEVTHRTWCNVFVLRFLKRSSAADYFDNLFGNLRLPRAVHI